MDASDNIPNYYDILGISVSSSGNEIKKAYHRIAREHHPDRNPKGNVEYLKTATLAYEFLKNSSNRKTYDAQLNKSKVFNAWDAMKHQSSAANQSRTGKSTRSTFAESSRRSGYSTEKASMAAASAAFHTYDTESIHSKAGRTYTRRPRESKFSRRENPNKFSESLKPSENNSKRKSTFSDSSDETASHQASLKDKTKSESMENEKDKDNQFSSKASPGRTKRTNDESAASPSKRRRVFDMNEFKTVPPFTQTDGGSSHFQALNGAVPRPSSTSRKRTRRPPTASNTSPSVSAAQPETTSKNLVQEFTTNSETHFDGLLQLHNERLSFDGSDPAGVWNNLSSTKAILDDLLVGTQKALQIIENDIST